VWRHDQGETKRCRGFSPPTPINFPALVRGNGGVSKGKPKGVGGFHLPHQKFLVLVPCTSTISGAGMQRDKGKPKGVGEIFGSRNANGGGNQRVWQFFGSRSGKWQLLIDWQVHEKWQVLIDWQVQLQLTGSDWLTGTSYKVHEKWQVMIDWYVAGYKTRLLSGAEIFGGLGFQYGAEIFWSKIKNLIK